MLLMAGPMIVLFELRHPDRPGRGQAAGQAGRPPRPSTTSATTRPRRSTPAPSALDDAPVAARLARPRGLSPRGRRRPRQPGRGPRPGRRARRRRARGLPAARARRRGCCRPRPAPRRSGRPPRRSPPGPARWSPSAATAPCTPRCRRSPGRRRRWPSSPPARATTWPCALGIPPDPVAAARAAAEDLVAGDVRTVDAGRTGDRWWATVLCCGFDSAVTDRANRLRWPRGRRRYDVGDPRRAGPRCGRGELDPRAGRRDAARVPVTLVAVGNTSWYGGGMKVCPGADPADGLFDVTVVGPLTRLELIRTEPRLTAGTHVEHAAGHGAPGGAGRAVLARASPPTPTASRWRRCPRSPSACPARCGSSAPAAPDASRRRLTGPAAGPSSGTAWTVAREQAPA